MNDTSYHEDQFDAYEEAIAAIKDVSIGINTLSISTSNTLHPPPSNETQYLNLRSLEGHAYCIRISTAGFQVWPLEDSISICIILLNCLKHFDTTRTIFVQF